MNLSLQILKTLDLQGKRLISETLLISELRIAGRDEPVREIRAEVEALEVAEEIFVASNVDVGRKLKVMDAGRARLAAAGL